MKLAQLFDYMFGWLGAGRVAADPEEAQDGRHDAHQLLPGQSM